MNNGNMRVLLPLFYITAENKIAKADEYDFPEIGSEEKNDMYYTSAMFPDEITVHPKIRKNRNGNYYGDIYFFGETSNTLSGYKRFTILPGYRMPKEDENEFVDLCRNRSLIVEDRECYEFIHKIRTAFPNYHFPESYKSEEVGNAILALYFSSHKGLLEILYKASLHNIANSITEIDDIDYRGENPSEILGNMPMKLLRIMNEEKLVSKMFTEKDQGIARKVYERYSGYIRKGEIPTCSQWNYLEHIYLNGNDFNRKVYEELKSADDVACIGAYDVYFKYREIVKGYYPISNKIPSATDICRITNLLVEISRYVKYSSIYDRRLQEMSRRNNEFRYEDKDLFVKLPESLKEFTMEAATQKNCLMNYFSDVVKGETVIAFVRRKEEPEKPYLTLEINNYELCQARGKCNRELTDEEYDFMEQYCEATGIEYEEWL